MDLREAIVAGLRELGIQVSDVSPWKIPDRLACELRLEEQIELRVGGVYLECFDACCKEKLSSTHETLPRLPDCRWLSGMGGASKSGLFGGVVEQAPRQTQ